MSGTKGGKPMKRMTILSALVLMTASATMAAEPEPGRTDGPEGSEYGKGGYQNWRTSGRFFVEGTFGAATFDFESEDGTVDESSTDLASGLNLGYMLDNNIGLQLGFSHIASDPSANLYSIGMRNSLGLEPFNYFFMLDAELYSPDGGSSKFGIAPGVGAEMVLNDKLQVGLRFQHDFIFADDAISINRFTARVQFNF